MSERGIEEEEERTKKCCGKSAGLFLRKEWEAVALFYPQIPQLEAGKP